MQTDFWSWLGTVGITGATALAAAYGLFKFTGEKWLSAKFGEQLEKFKHAQQRELESLKLRINTTFDRTVKLHSSEFEVLPELWSRLVEALDYAMSFTSSFQRIANLDQMTELQFENFLEMSELSDFEKDELRKTPDRTDRHAKLQTWQTLDRTWKKYYHFATYLQAKGIFIQPSLKAIIDDLRSLMWDAIHEKEFDLRHPRMLDSRTEKAQRLGTEGPPLRDKIEADIQRRLWTSATLPIADDAH